MGRYKQAPRGFECPYKNNCPHLGMSTKWASLELSDARHQEWNQGLRRHETEEYVEALAERNRVLEKENEELKARLKHQHRMRFKANKKPETRSPDTPPRKRGAPPGHPGWSRKMPERIDRAVNIEAPSSCPHCRMKGLSLRRIFTDKFKRTLSCSRAP